MLREITLEDVKPGEKFLIESREFIKVFSLTSNTSDYNPCVNTEDWQIYLFHKKILVTVDRPIMLNFPLKFKDVLPGQLFHKYNSALNLIKIYNDGKNIKQHNCLNIKTGMYEHYNDNEDVELI